MTSLGKSIVGLIIIGLIVLGGHFYTRESNSGEVATDTSSQSATLPTKATSAQATTTEQPAKTTGKKVPFSEFIKLGGSYSCTVNQTTNEASSQGKIFFSGEKVRGEFTTLAKGQSMTMSFLSTEGYTYTWTSMMPNMGFKMKNTSSTGTNGGAGMSSAWDANSIGDYNCEPWSVDAKKFEVPSGITFKTMGN